MQVTVTIPDEFAQQVVPAGCDAAQLLLEESVAAAYRERRLTSEQVRRLLGFETRMEADAFLRRHEVYDYAVSDFERDLSTLRRLEE